MVYCGKVKVSLVARVMEELVSSRRRDILSRSLVGRDGTERMA